MGKRTRKKLENYHSMGKFLKGRIKIDLNVMKLLKILYFDILRYYAFSVFNKVKKTHALFDKFSKRP